MTREQVWKHKRAGRPTSSAVKVLCTGGRANRTPEEIRVAKLFKDTRSTKDVEFGEGAMTYVYELVREKRRNKPTFNADNKNFRWGHNQEPYAIKWLRNAYPDWNIRHCSDEDEFADIVFNIAECGLGDSPDFYVGEDIIGEVKCPVDEAKFERIREMTREEAREEHEYQFAGHFIGDPNVKSLIYFIYDGQNDDDEDDVLDVLDPDRGIVFTYTREEFQPLIDEITGKVKRVCEFIEMCVNGECKVRDINSILI